MGLEENNLFIRKYRKKAIAGIKSVKGSISDEDIKKLDLIIEKSLNSPTVTFTNNDAGTKDNISLLSFLNWYFETNPTVTFEGTFFDSTKENLMGGLLDYLLKERKAAKKEMFKYEKGTDEFNSFDIKQKTMKVLANSFYGVMAAPLIKRLVLKNSVNCW